MIPQSAIVFAIILVLIGLAELCLGLFIFFRRRNSEIVYSFLLLNVGISFWVVANGLLPIWSDKALFFNQLAFLSAVVIACSILYFSIVFPFQERIVSKTEKILIFLPVGFFSYILFFEKSTFFNGQVSLRSYGYDIDVSNLSNLFDIFFLFFLCWSVFNLIKKLKHADGIHLSQIKQILFAIILAGLFGVITNLFFPWLFKVYQYYWVGPMFSVIWFGICAYQVLRR